MKKKITITIICAVLSCVCLIGTTFAWLVDSTTTVKNTFTVGDVDIELAETTGDEYKLIPGKTYSKNPTVTVKGGSEDCWVFVKIVKENNPDTYLTYSIDTSIWTALGEDGVYYKNVTSNAADQPFAIITGNTVTVKSSLTRTQLQAIGANVPAISFTAYAIQQEGFATPEAAWAEAKNAT